MESYDLETLGYYFNQNDELRSMQNDEKPNKKSIQQQYEVLALAVICYVQ